MNKALNRLLKSVALLVVACAPIAASTGPERPLVYFQASFNGALTGRDAGQTLMAPDRASAVAFVPAAHSPAAVITDDAVIMYPLPADFPGAAGALEFVFRPDFPQEPEEQGRTILTLRGETGEAGLTLSFVPVGARWEFRLNGRVLGQRWRGAATQGEWHHFLLTWDSSREPRATARLYHNGVGASLQTYVPPSSPFTRLELGTAGKSRISVDELVVYTRPLTEGQVGFLAASRGLREGRFSALAERIAADEREENTRLALRRAQLARLEGRVGRLIHLRGEKPRDFSFPGGIKATGIRPEDVGVIDLSRFSVIYFPEGTSYQLDREQQEVIIRYVENGGGYVGACAGANFACSIGLLDVTRRGPLLGAALFPIRVKPHTITDGYGETVLMHHGNGSIMTPGSGVRVIGTYNIPGYPDGIHAAIVVGQRGRGRAVLFGPHPLGGNIGAAGKSISLSAEELGTDRMFINAMLYAAAIIDEGTYALQTR